MGPEHTFESTYQKLVIIVVHIINLTYFKK